MGKTEKIGGIGKSPAIDKLNRLQNDRNIAVKEEMIKASVFEKEDAEICKMNSIIDTYHIGYGIGKRV